MRILNKAVLSALMIAGATAASATSFKVSIENPGVTRTTSAFSYVGTETFDRRPTGANQLFGTFFGTSGTISGIYSGVQIDGPNIYGSAGGTGNHATTYSTSGYSLALSTPDPRGTNYFGFYLSALDAGNQLAFYKGDSLLYSFTPDAVLAMVKDNPAYYGNPDAPFRGQDPTEPFAFLNFYDTDGTFDRITFSESPMVGGYESDNHTVGYFTATSGTVIGAVPEPASWAMFIGGFGLVGGMLRRRRRDARLDAAVR